MGVRILHDAEADLAVLYCSTSDWAFGPVIGPDNALDPVERAEAFLRWLRVDARTLSENQLGLAYSDWQAQEAMQYARERLEVLEKDEALDVLVEEEIAELAALREQLGAVR